MKNGALDYALETAGGRRIGRTVDTECFEFIVEIDGNSFLQFGYFDAACRHHLSSMIIVG